MNKKITKKKGKNNFVAIFTIALFIGSMIYFVPESPLSDLSEENQINEQITDSKLIDDSVNEPPIKSPIDYNTWYGGETVKVEHDFPDLYPMEHPEFERNLDYSNDHSTDWTLDTTYAVTDWSSWYNVKDALKDYVITYNPNVCYGIKLATLWRHDFPTYADVNYTLSLDIIVSSSSTEYTFSDTQSVDAGGIVDHYFVIVAIEDVGVSTYDVTLAIYRLHSGVALYTKTWSSQSMGGSLDYLTLEYHVVYVFVLFQ